MKEPTKFLARAIFCGCIAVITGITVSAQARPAVTGPVNQADPTAFSGPKVIQIDIEGLKKLLKPATKPLMINFWATWCDPCREEFPDLVKLDTAYKGKVDFLTISLDDLADINGDVPKFLTQMKAEMPAYLLHTPDEDVAIAVVSKNWSGNLPLTILIAPSGDTAYFRNGKIRYDAVAAEIDKLLAAPATRQ